MTVDGFWAVFLCGCLGGLLGELLKWYRFRTRRRLPAYVRSPFYWCVTVLVIVSGGGVAVAYGVTKVNVLMALNVGLSAPLLVQSLGQTYVAGKERQQLAEKGAKKSLDLVGRYLGTDAKGSFWEFIAG